MTDTSALPHGSIHRRSRGHRRRRRKVIALLAFLVVLAAVVGVAALANFRYLPALDEAKALRTDLERMVATIKDAGLGMDRTTLVSLNTDAAAARGRFTHLAALLATDPLVEAARRLPPTHQMVTGTDAVVAAGGDLMDAADAGLVLADRYVTIKERQTASASAGEGTAMAELVELMATGSADVDRILAAIDKAEATLASTPANLPAPIASIRDVIRKRLADYGPLLRTYAEMDSTLPDILGWSSPKRYLILTQDPAELRPTGGLIGSYGIMTFDKGRITQRVFQDVALLDIPLDDPFVTPPAALGRYLLGSTFPWQLADANWSPDFPTSAQDAIRLYLNEKGLGPVDGVMAISTYTIDEILSVTGPITVPAYNVTVASGETTLKVLQQTRVATDPSTNRKAFLSAFADKLFGSLLALPPSRWTTLLAHGDVFGAGHLLLAWFADPAAEAQIVKLGFGGAMRTDPGDYVYPVDSNVSPVSKLNAVTDRSLELTVRLDAFGNAANSLTVRWANNIDEPANKPYRDLPTVGNLTTLGMYFRLYVPERSRLDAVTAGTTMPITSASDVTDEMGRVVIANYFRIPPGSARLEYKWTSPYPADRADDGTYTYRLTIQHQPGQRPGPLRVEIRVPPGASIVDASPGLTINGASITLETTFSSDLIVVIRYHYAQETP
jgi:hypothetical protein